MKGLPIHPPLSAWTIQQGTWPLWITAFSSIKWTRPNDLSVDLASAFGDSSFWFLTSVFKLYFHFCLIAHPYEYLAKYRGKLSCLYYGKTVPFKVILLLERVQWWSGSSDTRHRLHLWISGNDHVGSNTENRSLTKFQWKRETGCVTI